MAPYVVAVPIQQKLIMDPQIRFTVDFLSTAAKSGSGEPRTPHIFDTRFIPHAQCSFLFILWQCHSATNVPGKGTTEFHHFV